MYNCIAHEVYENCRGKSAFNIKCVPHKKYKNQHATVYKFEDNSCLILYKDFSISWRAPNKFIMAVRIKI